MDIPDGYPVYLIDGPSAFAPLEELEAFRQQVLEMLEKYPNHPQWAYELKAVEEHIESDFHGQLKSSGREQDE